SLTWDQGHEMAEHLRFTIDTGVAVYFCNPHSPWQRGTAENTNGLLRQYFPKGKSLAGGIQAALDRVADELNGRPQKTLGWKTSAQKLADLIESDLSAAKQRNSYRDLWCRCGHRRRASRPLEQRPKGSALTPDHWHPGWFREGHTVAPLARICLRCCYRPG